MFSLELLLHHTSHIGHKRLQQQLSRLNILINCLNELKQLRSLLSHIIDPLFAYSSEFVANESLPYDTSHRFISRIFHSFVGGIASEEAANEALHSDY